MNPIKYPRTPHLPWSPGMGADDVSLPEGSRLYKNPLVVTEKMDGENTTLYGPPGFHMHARSLDSRHHPSRSWVKQLHARIMHQIPEGWRICGENLFARHSIAYHNLPSYFLVFSVWDENNECLDWETTRQFCDNLSLHTVPELIRTHWDDPAFAALPESLPQWNAGRMEGFVVRSEGGFPYSEFALHTAKWVRKNHVQTDSHWMHQAVRPNQLADPDDQTGASADGEANREP